MSASLALQHRRIAAARVTKHRQKQQRAETTSLPLERARRLQGGIRKGPSPALSAHCDQVRARVGIPVGLWAVVTGRINTAQYGNALLSGHTELLEPIDS